MLQAKEFDKAADLLEKMAAQVPDDLEIKGNLGMAYLGLKKKEKVKNLKIKNLKVKKKI